MSSSAKSSLPLLHWLQREPSVKCKSSKNPKLDPKWCARAARMHVVTLYIYGFVKKIYGFIKKHMVLLRKCMVLLKQCMVLLSKYVVLLRNAWFC